MGGSLRSAGLNSTLSVFEMRQPGNRDRKAVPRVEPITGDVNTHSLTARKRLPGEVGPSPERLHTDCWLSARRTMGRRSRPRSPVDPPGSRQPSRPYCSIRLLPRPLTGALHNRYASTLGSPPRSPLAQEHRRGDTGLVQRPRDKRGEIARGTARKPCGAGQDRPRRHDDAPMLRSRLGGRR